MLFWCVNSQNALSSSGNLAPVGNTETNDPKDAVGGIGDDPCGGFAVGGEVGIGEEVGNQFGALHAERLEAVALTPMTTGERERQSVEVEEFAVGREGWSG